MKKKKYITIDDVSVKALIAFSPDHSFSDGIEKANLVWRSTPNSAPEKKQLLEKYSEISIRNYKHKKHCISIDQKTINEILEINENFSKAVRLLARFVFNKCLKITLDNKRNQFT